MIQETPKKGFFMTVANSLKTLVILTNNSNSDVAVVLDRRTV